MLKVHMLWEFKAKIRYLCEVWGRMMKLIVGVGFLSDGRDSRLSCLRAIPTGKSSKVHLWKEEFQLFTGQEGHFL